MLKLISLIAAIILALMIVFKKDSPATTALLKEGLIDTSKHAAAAEAITKDNLFLSSKSNAHRIVEMEERCNIKKAYIILERKITNADSLTRFAKAINDSLLMTVPYAANCIKNVPIAAVYVYNTYNDYKITHWTAMSTKRLGEGNEIRLQQ